MAINKVNQGSNPVSGFFAPKQDSHVVSKAGGIVIIVAFFVVLTVLHAAHLI